MNVLSPVNDEDNGEDTYIDESDIINEYDIDDEELPDADEEGGSDGEEEFEEIQEIICYVHMYFITSSVLKNGRNLRSKARLSSKQQKTAFEWVRWHPNGHLVLAGAEDSSIWMWNAANADRDAYLNVFTGHGGSVTCGDFTPDGKTICSGSDDATMNIWNPKNAEIIHHVSGHPYHTEGITCLTISSDSALVLTGSSDGSIHVVNISTGKVASSLLAHSDSVECAAFQASSRRDSWRVATGGMDKKLIIWDQHSIPRCICEHEEAVTCLLWLAGSRYIATGCVDGKVRIWDSLSGDCAKVLSGHSDAIQSIASSSTGEFLVSVSIDGTARVFEVAEFM